MAKTYAAPQSLTDKPRPPITLSPVKSGQVKAIGYDPATETLAVSFNGGPGSIYHYPGVKAETYAEFLKAESIGKFFGAHIKALPFEKFAADPEPEKAEAATA